jgi:hypothetical protein
MDRGSDLTEAEPIGRDEGVLHGRFLDPDWGPICGRLALEFDSRGRTPESRSKADDVCGGGGFIAEGPECS